MATLSLEVAFARNILSRAPVLSRDDGVMVNPHSYPWHGISCHKLTTAGGVSPSRTVAVA